jgi:hypothetical protein
MDMWLKLDPQSPDEAYLIGALAGGCVALTFVGALLGVVAMYW